MSTSTEVFSSPKRAEPCAICLEDLASAELLVTPDCNHWFCLDCIADLISHPNHPTDCRCPMCRTVLRWCRCGEHTMSVISTPPYRHENWMIYCNLGATNPRQGRLADDGTQLQHNENWVTPGRVYRWEEGHGDFVRASDVSYIREEIDYKRLPTVLVSFGKFLALVATRPREFYATNFEGRASSTWMISHIYSHSTIAEVIDRLGNALITECFAAEKGTAPHWNGVTSAFTLGTLAWFIVDHFKDFFVNFITETNTTLGVMRAGVTLTAEMLLSANLEQPFYKTVFLVREFLVLALVFIHDDEGNQEAPRFIEVDQLQQRKQSALEEDPLRQKFIEAMLYGVFGMSYNAWSTIEKDWEGDLRRLGEMEAWIGRGEHWTHPVPNYRRR